MLGLKAGNLNPLHETPRNLVPFALEAFRVHKQVKVKLARLGCANYEPSPVRRILLARLKKIKCTWTRRPLFSAQPQGFPRHG